MREKPTSQFRHAVSVLKKQGLLPKALSNGTKLDARYAYPSWRVKGKSLSSIIKKYDDVVSGKQTAVTVPPAQVKAYQKAGYKTSQGKVLVPHLATEKVALKPKSGQISIKSRSGIERVQIPVPYHNLTQYLKDIRRDKNRINKMKRENEYFGFKFFGFNSSELYADIDAAIADVQKYESVNSATNRTKQVQVYKNLEIFKMNLSGARQWEFPSDRRKKQSREYNRRQAATRRKKLSKKPKYIQEQYKAEAAERQRQYRARLKGKAKTQYKRAAKKRAADSRKKRKPTKKGKRK